MKKQLFNILLFFIAFSISAQVFPVQINSNVNAPYLPSVASYATVPAQNYLVNIFTADLSVVNRPAKLKLTIEGQGILATSTSIVAGAPVINLNGGETLNLTNIDLAPYFRLENLIGISPQQYSNNFLQGTYKFCFEVIDELTNQKISQKTCAPFYFILNEPPFLNIPANSSVVPFQDMTNILFTWTPRHVNATNIIYNFKLVEVPQGLNSNIVILAPNALYEVITNNTVLNYDMSLPQLLTGNKYAWRVQAVQAQGFGEFAVFNNQGYSQVYEFEYPGPCEAPLNVISTSLSATSCQLNWGATPKHIDFVVQYRKQGSQEWFFTSHNNNTAIIHGLEAGAVYEFQVGGVCMGNVTIFSVLNTFTQPINNQVSVNCGIAPNIDLTNTILYTTNLAVGDAFIAGDFTVNVLSSSLAVDQHTGEGFVRVPYLNSAKVAIEYKDIKLNTEKKLVSGEVKFKYDPAWSNVLDINQLIADLTNLYDQGEDFFDGLSQDVEENIEQVGFVVASVTVVNGQIIVTGTNGQTQTFDQDIKEISIITDTNGNVWGVPAGGTTATLLQQGSGFIPNSVNTNGVGASGQVTAITAPNGAKVIFTTVADAKYGDDKEEASYSNVAKLKEKYKTIKAGNDDYKLLYKIVVNDGKATKSTDKIKATVSGNIDKTKIVFNLKGVQLTSTNGFVGNDIILDVPVFESSSEGELMAIFKDSTNSTAGNKPSILGVAKIIAAKEVKDVEVVLIPVNGATIPDDIQTKLNRIYQKQTGVNFIITKASNYVTTKTTIDFGQDYLLENYTPDMRVFQDEYVKTNVANKFDKNKYYLFIMKNVTPSKPVSGFMPLHRQYGFIFHDYAQSSLTVTTVDGIVGEFDKLVAHELGHGIFELEHPWQEYNTVKGATNWLMDYKSTGIHIPYMQVQKISHPKFGVYVFQDMASGEFAGYRLTPDWKPFSFSGSSTYISGAVQQPNGAVYGIAYDNKNYNAVLENGKYTYKSGETVLPNLVVLETLADDKEVVLFWNRGVCGYHETYTAKWGYLKDKKGFNIDNVTDSGKIVFKERVPCIVNGVNQGGNTGDAECDDKDISILNIQKNALIALINDADIEKITTKVNEVDICTIRKLTHEEIEKFIIKISSLSDLDERHEKALLRLMNGIKEDKYKIFYALLERDSNKLIKHYIDEFTDHSINPFDGDNYTSLNTMLLKMYQSNPKAWIDRIPSGELSDYFVDKYFTKPTVKILSLNDLISGTSEIYQQGFQYNPDNGKIRITHTATSIQAVVGNSSGAYYAPVGAPRIMSVLEVDPLTPVVIDFNDDLQVIEMALNNAGYQKGKEIIIPALFLKFGLDKLNSNSIQKSSLFVLNGMTIVTGMPAIIQGATMAKRLWALAVVAGAAGDIVVNTQYVQTNYPRLATATNVFNGAMGLVGLKNLVTNTGIRSFATNLPSQVKQAFKDSNEIKSIIAAKYLDWKIATQSLTNVTDAEKQLITQQEKVWKALGCVENVLNGTGNLAKYTKIRSYLGDGRIKAYLNNQQLLDFENVLKTANDDVLKVMDEFKSADEFAEMVRGFKDNPTGFSSAIKTIETFSGPQGWLKFWRLTPRMEISLNTIAQLKNGNKIANVGNATNIQLSSIHAYTANGDFINVPYRYNPTWFGEYNTRAIQHINEGLNELRKIPYRKIIDQTVFSGKTFLKTDFESKFLGKMNTTHSYNGYMSTSKLESVAEGFIDLTKQWATGSGEKIAVIQRVTSKNGVYIDDMSDWGKNLGKTNHPDPKFIDIQIQEEVLLNSQKLKQISEPIPVMVNGVHKTIDGMKVYYVDFLEIL